MTNNISLALEKLSVEEMTEYHTAIDAALTIGRLADAAVNQTVFKEYQKLKSQNTLQAQHRDLRLFGNFVNGIYDRAEASDFNIRFRLSAGQLYRDAAAWKVITHGLVRLFKSHLEHEGYSLSSINRYLSTIRRYANLAASAEQIDPNTNIIIQGVKGFLGSEEKHVNAERPVTRRSTQKTKAVQIPSHIIQALKSEETFPDTNIGVRDRLIICMLLDHGLRSSEVAGLRTENFNLTTGYFFVYRTKTNMTDQLTLSDDSRSALENYLDLDLPPLPHSNEMTNQGTSLLRSGNNRGNLRSSPMTRSAVSKVLTKYGQKLAIEYNHPALAKLSAHDGRHQWATDVLASGTQIDRLQQAGGWKSPTMPLRYANKKKIADEGVLLDR